MSNRENLINHLNNYGKDRTWGELAELYKIGENLSNRKRAKKTQDLWRGYLKGKTTPTETTNNRYELPIKKIKVWETYNGDKRESIEYDLKNDLPFDFESLKKEFVKSISVLPQPRKERSNKKALFIYSSDKHIGAQTLKNSLYPNLYSKEEFEKRLKKTVSESEQLKDQFGHFEDLYFIDLGDSVDGWSNQTTRGGHHLPQNMDNKEMFEAYVNTHKELFDYLHANPISNNVHYIAMTNDNHAGQFGYIVNRALEIYLNVKYPYINTTICDKFFHNFKCGIHNFILSHGKDEADMKSGLPLHLNDKAETYINKYINYYDIKSPIHFIKGDLHCSATEYGQNFRYKSVMSMYGASRWIMSNFGPTKAGVDYDIVFLDTNRILEGRLVF